MPIVEMVTNLSQRTWSSDFYHAARGFVLPTVSVAGGGGGSKNTGHGSEMKFSQDVDLLQRLSWQPQHQHPRPHQHSNVQQQQQKKDQQLTITDTALASAAIASTTLKRLVLRNVYLPVNKNTGLCTETSLNGLLESVRKSESLAALSLAHTTIFRNAATALEVVLNANSTLDLGSCKIGSLECHGLCAHSSLTNISLADNEIGDEGATARGMVLKTNNTQVLLDLRCCQIGSSGCVALSSGLGANLTLTEIHFADNSWRQGRHGNRDSA